MARVAGSARVSAHRSGPNQATPASTASRLTRRGAPSSQAIAPASSSACPAARSTTAAPGCVTPNASAITPFSGRISPIGTSSIAPMSTVMGSPMRTGSAPRSVRARTLTGRSRARSRSDACRCRQGRRAGERHPSRPRGHAGPGGRSQRSGRRRRAHRRPPPAPVNRRGRWPGSDACRARVLGHVRQCLARDEPGGGGDRGGEGRQLVDGHGRRHAAPCGKCMQRIGQAARSPAWAGGGRRRGAPRWPSRRPARCARPRASPGRPQRPRRQAGHPRQDRPRPAYRRAARASPTARRRAAAPAPLGHRRPRRAACAASLGAPGPGRAAHPGAGRSWRPVQALAQRPPPAPRRSPAAHRG